MRLIRLSLATPREVEVAREVGFVREAVVVSPPMIACDAVVATGVSVTAVIGGDEVALSVVPLFTLLLLIVPPTAPPTTAPMTMRTATTMAMMPLRLRQKDVWEVVAAGADAAEPSFSPEPAFAVAGAEGTETGCGRIVSGGGGPRTGVHRGDWLGRLTL